MPRILYIWGFVWNVHLSGVIDIMKLNHPFKKCFKANSEKFAISILLENGDNSGQSPLFWGPLFEQDT